MKRKLPPSQDLNQENIQEGSSQRRSSIPHHQPTPPPPQPQPINETNQQDHEATLDLNTSLSPIPQTMPPANASSCPTNTLRLPSQSILPSHATPRINPHSQETHQERAIALPPRAALPTARFSSTSRSVRMPLPADNVPSLLPQQRPRTVSESPPATPPPSPRPQLQPNRVIPQQATRRQLRMPLPPPPPSTPDAGSSTAAKSKSSQ